MIYSRLKFVFAGIRVVQEPQEVKLLQFNHVVRHGKLKLYEKQLSNDVNFVFFIGYRLFVPRAHKT